MSRVPELDGLRGVAILLVVVSHSLVIPAHTGGMVGVTLFFVLSGYLITHLLISEQSVGGAISLRSFYVRRAFRLLPALVTYMIGITILARALEVKIPVFDISWPPLLYLANYAQILGSDLLIHRHTWSLAVEEHFYLVWPLFLVLGASRRLRTLSVAVGLLFAWRLLVGLVDPRWAYMGTDTNAYALGLGCLLASARAQGLRLKLPQLAPAFGTMLLVLFSMIRVEDLSALLRIDIWLAPVIALCGVLTISAVVDNGSSFLRWRWLAWFGSISYALYLWHAPLLQIPPFAGSRQGRLLAVAIGVVLAWVSWVLVERPILKSALRSRFTPGRSTEPNLVRGAFRVDQVVADEA